MQNSGSFIISLDYELMWGLIDLPSAKHYGESNVRHVEGVIQSMVSLFEKYDVKATFATVGMLMCKDKNELLKYVPTLKPRYINKNLSPYEGYIDNLEAEDYYKHFAPKTIEILKNSKAVEIGTHTFCHYYCLERGQNEEEFEHDLLSALKVAKAKGIQLKSIVFPRNNVNDAYLKICFRQGILCYRGNATKFFTRPKSRFELFKNRLGRFLDSYLPLNNESCYDISTLRPSEDIPVNVPASRFFRPYSKKLAFLEPLRLYRIKKEIKHAAQNGQLYHIWWHPHNFGANIDKNMKNLEKVLKYYEECHTKYGMQSYTMSDLANFIISKK
jgi:peptidoglycan/xylan/chitin deacetylase (PgdA/CDA1 family)